MQTTRGTPLTQPPDDTIGPNRRSRVGMVVFIALLIIGIDQATKAIALATLEDRAPIELLGGVLTLRLVRNPGAAFGMAQGFTVLLTLVAAGVTVVILRVARRLSSLPWSIALSLLLGGALGNLVDRVFRPPAVLQGHVIDFLQLPHWPVFNVADSAIVCAGVLMVILTFRGVPLTSTEPAPGDQVQGPQRPDPGD